MALTILPCPFCGFADVQIGEPEPGRIAIDCPECACIGPFGNSTEEAAGLWNLPTVMLRQTERRAAVITEQSHSLENRISNLQKVAA